MMTHAAVNAVQHVRYATWRKMMSKTLQEKLDEAALALQPILYEMLKEIEEDEL